MKNIEILYEDEQIFIVNKPAGLAVQGGAGVKNSLDAILAKMRHPAPLLVHRLDKDTSGVLLAAKGREAAAKISQLFSGEKKITKKYMAVCAGHPAKNESVIKDELSIRGNVKKAETKYKVIKTAALKTEEIDFVYSVLELELGTGRMHQIRRHLAMNGMPVLGDDKYGDFKLNKQLQKSIKLKHLLLHSSQLTIKERNINVTAPLPDYFKQFIYADI